MRDVIRQKIADSLAWEPQPLTRREACMPKIPRKAHAVIGMRRSGKTCFLHQCLRDRLAEGAPREALVYFSFEDERLAGMQTAQLDWVLEEYFLQYPQYRDRRQVTFFFDEIQLVPGWESFVRRILDSEKVDVFVSGSSARMLSREVASALRGRGTETVIFPFSFRESLRHLGTEPPSNPRFIAKAQRSVLARAFMDYLAAGGFPEAQGLSAPDRLSLLTGYVDTCIFRDVVERHNVTNVVALRWLVRQLLGNAGGHFSVSKFYHDLRSQGISTAKDGLHKMLSYLEDAFLVRTVELAAASQRRRQVHTRKIYPVDTGLIPVFDRSGKANLGHALETATLVELERRGYHPGYVLTPDGLEVDFLAQPADGAPLLIQVAADISSEAVRDRELRALMDAMPLHRHAKPMLLSLSFADTQTARAKAQSGVTVRTAWEWFLES